MRSRTLITLFFLGILALITWVAYQRRVRLAAWVWHVRHHGTLMVAGYVVPVPDDWYVHDRQPTDRLLIKLSPSELPATISFLEEPPPKDLDYWKSVMVSQFKKSGHEPTVHEIKINGETIYCLGGSPMPPLSSSQMPALITWDCRTPGRLEILVTAPESDVTEVWDILSHIREGKKRSQ